MSKSIRETLSEETYNLLKSKGLRPVYHTQGKSKKDKYSKERFLNCYKGFDFMENLILVRPYIQKRYGIDLALLELLLMLTPKRFFTQKDYSKYPKQFKYRSVKNLIATGFIDVVQHGDNIGKEVFTVNRKGIEIVNHFYECLSGEKKIPENATNPLFSPKATAFEKRQMELIKKLNQLPASAAKKQLFE